jgi:hypothetical protein
MICLSSWEKVIRGQERIYAIFKAYKRSNIPDYTGCGNI